MIDMRIWMFVLLVGCDPRPLVDTDDEPRPASLVREHDREPPPPARRTPLEVDWSKDSIGNSKGAIKGGGQVETSGYKGKYHITLRDLPRHSKWKVGTQSGKVMHSLALIDVEILSKVANLTWAELDSVDPEAELELELQDGRTGKLKLPPIQLGYTVGEMLKTVENAPVLFGKEPDDPKKQDSLYYPAGVNHVIGKAGKLYEIDWVLIAHKVPEPKGTKTCGGYTSKGKPMPDLTLKLVDTEAIIFDRRTGSVVEKKVFPPNPECPMFTFTRGDNTTESTTPYSAIESWGRSKLKR